MSEGLQQDMTAPVYDCRLILVLVKKLQKRKVFTEEASTDDAAQGITEFLVAHGATVIIHGGLDIKEPSPYSGGYLEEMRY